MVLPPEAGAPGTPVAVEASGGPRGTTWTGVAVVGQRTRLPLKPGSYVIRGTPPYGPVLEATCDIPEEHTTMDVRLEPVPDSGSLVPGAVSDWSSPFGSLPGLVLYSNGIPALLHWLAKVIVPLNTTASRRSAGAWQATVVRARHGGRPRELIGPHPVTAPNADLADVRTGTSPTYLRLTGPVHTNRDVAAPRSTRYVALPSMTRAHLRVRLVATNALAEASGSSPEAVTSVRLADLDADALLAHLAAHRPVRAAQIADRMREREESLLRKDDAAAACLLGYFRLTHRTDTDTSTWTSALAERFAAVPDALVIHAAALTAQKRSSPEVRALLLKAADPGLGLPRFTQGLRLLVSVLEDLAALDDDRGLIHQPTTDALKRAEAYLVAVDPDQILATYDGRSPLAPPGLPLDWSPSSVSAPAEAAAALPFAGYVDEALRKLAADRGTLSDDVGRAGPAKVCMKVHHGGRDTEEIVLTVSRERGNAWRPVQDLAIAYSAASGSMLIAVTDADGRAAFHVDPGDKRPSRDGTRKLPWRQGFSLAPTRQVRHVPLVQVPEPAVALAAHTAERVRLQRRVRTDGITLDLHEYDDRSTGVPTLRVEAHTSAVHSSETAAEGGPYRWASFLARPAVAPDAPHELYVVPLVPRAGGRDSGALDMGPSADGLDWYVSPFVTGSVEKDVAARSLARASDPRTAQALRSAAHDGDFGLSAW